MLSTEKDPQMTFGMLCQKPEKLCRIPCGLFVWPRVSPVISRDFRCSTCKPRDTTSHLSWKYHNIQIWDYFPWLGFYKHNMI